MGWATSMLVTDLGDVISWRTLLDVVDRFYTLKRSPTWRRTSSTWRKKSSPSTCHQHACSQWAFYVAISVPFLEFWTRPIHYYSLLFTGQCVQCSKNSRCLSKTKKVPGVNSLKIALIRLFLIPLYFESSIGPELLRRKIWK